MKKDGVSSNTCLKKFLVLQVLLSWWVVLMPIRAQTDRDGGVMDENRNYDWRISHNRDFHASPSHTQREALEVPAQENKDLMVSFDEISGVTRTLYRRNGYLSPAASQRDALDIGVDFIEDHLALLGLNEADLAEFEIIDRVYSRLTGATHLYLRQMYGGISVYNGSIQVNVNRDGRLISLNNAFVRDLAASVNRAQPVLTAVEAVLRTAAHLDVRLQRNPRALTPPHGITQQTRIDATTFSLEEVAAQLMWLPIRERDTRLVWNFRIYTTDGRHVYDFTVDAVSGLVLTRVDWVASADYKVYPMPIESPNHTSPPPPADARQTVVEPHDTTASPFGWHDTDGVTGPEFTILRGNNAHAYVDLTDNGTPPGFQPDGGPGLSFVFPMDLTQDPSTYEEAATTNLFYWNNIIHDVTYQYGFDEEGGNFQVNNYGRGGVGNDDVRAEAQDGRDVGNTNNAFFFTPPDGQRPRMEMYVFDITTPRRDGDFDHGIIIHEFGHGISNRLIGGPSNVGCLDNIQQPGEGISDWWSLVLTHAQGAQGTDIRGSGTYVLGQPTNGPGIRPQPYSTDPTVNTYTYESISGVSFPHGLGSVWAQANWEVYWALIDEHGFDPDFYNSSGGAGNQRMMLYTIEGFKNTICSPAFTDVRDGIIQAAMDHNNGEDVCLIWQAFAAFGLGLDADSGGPNSRFPTNGFAIPQECCPISSGPDNLTAQLDQDLHVVLDWTGGAGLYNLYRTSGGCPGADYQLIAENITETTFTDTGVTPGGVFAYVVRSVSLPNRCESEDSDCAEILVCDELLNLLPLWNVSLSVRDLIICL